MDQKSIAIKLRKLASDPENQTYIVQEEGCMSGLLSFLETKDDSILTISLQALYFLSSHPKNKKPLSEKPNLLKKLSEFTESDNKSIKDFSQNILDNLQSYVNGSQESNEGGKKPNKFTPKYLQSTVLYIPDMDTPQLRAKVETVIIRVKGVISITTDKETKQVTIYTTTDDPKQVLASLLRVIKYIGLNATPLNQEVDKGKDAKVDKNKNQDEENYQENFHNAIVEVNEEKNFEQKKKKKDKKKKKKKRVKGLLKKFF